MLNVNDNAKNKLSARGDTKLFSSLENSFDKVVILTTDNCLNCIKIRAQKYNTNMIF